ncbi:MAG: flagellar biosynthesis protein FlgN [Treponema sp.]|nr:flagellar biosynthesis protein FlgN [Treponema sp.]
MELTQEELNERIAVLRRYRTLLEAQRNKFREYLMVLEKQEAKIEADDSEALEMHAQLENQIVANIAGLQKVILPIQRMYEKAGIEGAETMQAELQELQQRVLAQNEKNRSLLASRLTAIRTQMTDMRVMNPYRARRSIYAEKTAGGSMIAVEA